MTDSFSSQRRWRRSTSPGKNAVHVIFVMGKYSGPMLKGSVQAKATFWYGLDLVQKDLNAVDAATRALGVSVPPLSGRRRMASVQVCGQ